MRLRLQVETLHAYQVSAKPIGFLQVLQRFQGVLSGVIRFGSSAYGWYSGSRGSGLCRNVSVLLGFCARALRSPETLSRESGMSNLAPMTEEFKAADRLRQNGKVEEALAAYEKMRGKGLDARVAYEVGLTHATFLENHALASDALFRRR